MPAILACLWLRWLLHHAGIVRLCVKSLVECVRLQTLSRAGLQQLQLDVHYLRPLLQRQAAIVAYTTLHILQMLLTRNQACFMLLLNACSVTAATPSCTAVV